MRIQKKILERFLQNKKTGDNLNLVEAGSYKYLKNDDWIWGVEGYVKFNYILFNNNCQLNQDVCDHAVNC